jgi:hypothetical protein
MLMQAAPQKLALFRSDAFAGMLIMIVAAIFFFGAWKLRAGTLERMGPGYVPIAMSIFLFLMGSMLTIRGFVKRSGGEGATFPSLRPTLIVVLSPLLFAFLIGRVGLVITVLPIRPATEARSRDGRPTGSADYLLRPRLRIRPQTLHSTVALT